MTETYTAVEVKEKHIAVMGEPLGSAYNALWNELALLYFNWNEYLVLYGTKETRIDLMNKVAARFFWIVQRTLWRECVLHFARITDSEKSTGKLNLTIKALPRLVSDIELKEKLEKLIKDAEEKCRFWRELRNRQLAHADYLLATGKEATPLKTASRKDIIEALDSIANVLNAVLSHFNNSTALYDSGPNPKGATALLCVLHDGLRFDSERRQRLENGEYREGDFGPRDL